MGGCCRSQAYSEHGGGVGKLQIHTENKVVFTILFVIFAFIQLQYESLAVVSQMVIKYNRRLLFNKIQI